MSERWLVFTILFRVKTWFLVFKLCISVTWILYLTGVLAWVTVNFLTGKVLLKNIFSWIWMTDIKFNFTQIYYTFVLQVICMLKQRKLLGSWIWVEVQLRLRSFLNWRYKDKTKVGIPAGMFQYYTALHWHYFLSQKTVLSAPPDYIAKINMFNKTYELYTHRSDNLTKQ